MRIPCFRPGVRLILPLVLATSAASHLGASTLLVNPTLVEVPPSRRAAVITVTNTSQEPVNVQFRAFAWAQPAGDDVMTPADDVIVSPPIAGIKAGGRQVFRVLLPSARPASEASYRLILDELPDAAAPARLAVRLRLSIPVFASTRASQALPLSWHLRDDKLEVVNSGGRRVRIRTVTLYCAALTTPLGALTGAYILAGSARSWPVVSTACVQPIVHGAADTGPIDAAVSHTPVL